MAEESGVRVWTHPGALACDKLVIFCLNAGPAANIKVLRLKVRVIQLFRSLQERRERSGEREEDPRLGSIGRVYKHKVIKSSSIQGPTLDREIRE